MHRWRKKKKSISALKRLTSYRRNKSYKLGIRKDVSTYLLLHERCVLSGTVRWSVSIQRKHACSVGRHQLIHTWRYREKWNMRGACIEQKEKERGGGEGKWREGEWRIRNEGEWTGEGIVLGRFERRGAIARTYWRPTKEYMQIQL